MPEETGWFTGLILIGADEIHYSYYLPESYDESKIYPMVVVMPGYDMMWFGEESAGKNLDWDGVQVWTKQKEDIIVVSAQLTDWGEQSAGQSIELTEYMLKNFSVDRNRVYAVGYSAGGETMSQAVSMRSADTLGVDTDYYSLWGGSAGARMAAYLGSYGSAQFDGNNLPRAGAVIMQYTGHTDYTPNDPPTYVCVGENDGIASWRTMESRVNNLKVQGINTEFHLYPNLGHGFGIGTSAEGWLDDAVAFWDKNGGVTL